MSLFRRRCVPGLWCFVVAGGCFSPDQLPPIGETDTGPGGSTAEVEVLTTSRDSDEPGPESTDGSANPTSDATSITPEETSATDSDTTDTGDDDDSGGSSSGEQTCDNGLRACGTQTCDIDVSSDPEHCGGCGNSCLGGACDEGVCDPVSLFLEGDLRDLAVDEDFVYFATGATVERIPQEADAMASVLLSTGVKEGSEKRDVADSGDSVVLAGGTPAEGYVLRFPKGGGAAENLYFDAPGVGGVQIVRVTENRAFWGTRSPSQPFTYAVLGATLDGAETVTYASGVPSVISTIAANNAFVYYMQRDELGRVRRRPVGLGATQDVLSGFDICYSIVPTEDELFLSCEDLDDLGMLLRADLNGDNLEVLLMEGESDFVVGRALTLSGARLVWWDSDSGTNYLREFDLDDETTATLYATEVAIVNNRLAVDSAAYFFAEDASIRMLARH